MLVHDDVFVSGSWIIEYGRLGKRWASQPVGAGSGGTGGGGGGGAGDVCLSASKGFTGDVSSGVG
jgi:hypothetical protein